MPSRFWRSVASAAFGRPSSFFVSDARCGASTMHPVCPVQDSKFIAASFFRRNGLPALPKMLSTKSRLHTSDPGAKKRISIVFSPSPFGTAGHTVGRR